MYYSISTVTKYTVQWPKFWHEEFDYSETEGGPIARTDYVGTTHIQDKEFIIKIVTYKEACQIDLERQIVERE